MKNRSIIVLCLGLLAVPCFAGTIDVSGRAGVYTAPGSAGTSMMYGVSADYKIIPSLSVRGAVDTTTYTVNNVQTTYTPVTLDLIYSQTVAEYLHPYAGAGVSYNTWNVGGASSTTSGAQAETGVSFNFGGFSAGLEYRYMWPDFNHTNITSSSYNAYATGSFTQSISF